MLGHTAAPAAAAAGAANKQKQGHAEQVQNHGDARGVDNQNCFKTHLDMLNTQTASEVHSICAPFTGYEASEGPMLLLAWWFTPTTAVQQLLLQQQQHQAILASLAST
jgi:hypothetical protein